MRLFRQPGAEPPPQPSPEFRGESKQNVFRPSLNSGRGSERSEWGWGRMLLLLSLSVLTLLAPALAAAQGGDPAAPTAEATAEATETPTTIDISGQVVNGTAGESVPDDQEIVLFLFDDEFNQQQLTTSVNAEGQFAFDDVPYSNGSAYVATTNYRGRVFASGVARGEAMAQDAADGTIDMPITIYELTEDPDVIQINGMVTRVNVVGDSLEVAQVVSVVNTSDRAFSSSTPTEDGRFISLVITLPPGSVIVDLGDGQQRYVVAQDDFTLFDTVPVLPNTQHNVQVIYLIPYEGDAIIEQPMNYAFDGRISLLVQPTSVNVVSEQLQPLGTETLGSSTFASYGADLSLAAGDVIRYDLSGSGIEVSSAGEVAVVPSNNLPLIIAGVIIAEIALIAGLYVVYRRRRGQPAPKTAPPDEAQTSDADRALIDGLVAQIAALDAQYEAGELDADSYQRQRTALKTRLAGLMERKNS